jgi:hypothetical protein
MWILLVLRLLDTWRWRHCIPSKRRWPSIQRHSATPRKAWFLQALRESEGLWFSELWSAFVICCDIARLSYRGGINTYLNAVDCAVKCLSVVRPNGRSLSSVSVRHHSCHYDMSQCLTDPPVTLYSIFCGSTAPVGLRLLCEVPRSH